MAAERKVTYESWYEVKGCLILHLRDGKKEMFLIPKPMKNFKYNHGEYIGLSSILISIFQSQTASMVFKLQYKSLKLLSWLAYKWQLLLLDWLAQFLSNLLTLFSFLTSSHHLEISYYIIFLGHLDSNGFQLKWRFGTLGNWKNQNQLNISANLAHLTDFWDKWAGLAVLFSW